MAQNDYYNQLRRFQKYDIINQYQYKPEQSVKNQNTNKKPIGKKHTTQSITDILTKGYINNRTKKKYMKTHQKLEEILKKNLRYNYSQFVRQRMRGEIENNMSWKKYQEQYHLVSNTQSNLLNAKSTATKHKNIK